MFKRVLSVMGILAVAGVVSACSPEVHWYEPGVYKGAEDPQAREQAVREREAALRDRIAQVHEDR